MDVTAPLAPLDDLLDHERSTALHAGGQVFDLQTVTRLIERLDARHGPPRRPGLSVHIAGSEGKTSLTERLAAGLASAGLVTGSFTSPHLKTPLERLRVDLALPPEAAVASAVGKVAAEALAMSPRPSWFEALFAVARELFSDLAVDATVWETGLGGRLDATRLAPADLCVITSISLEHTALLGHTVAEIAAEKAGILRPGVPVLVAADLAPEAADVIAGRAEALSCPLFTAPHPGDAPRSLVLARAAWELLARRGVGPPWDAGRDRALASWRVRGDGEHSGRVVFDRAHSLASVRDLAARLARRPFGPVVLGVTHGRDGAAMAAALHPVAAPLVLTRAPGPRGLDPALLAGDLPGVVRVDDPSEALARALAFLDAGEPGDGAVPEDGRRIHVTGSLYLVGALLPDGSACP